MVLSEAEAESRLAALRRERAALDRAIADLTLYLELGRRLAGGPPSPDPAGTGAPSSRDPAPASVPVQMPASPVGQSSTAAPFLEAAHESMQRPIQEPIHAPLRQSAAPPAGAAPPPGEKPTTAEPTAAGETGPGPLAPPSGADETKSVPDGLSEGALARRYGRALIREALAVLEAAGRPLHAGEILSALAARGFTVPGQQDPVAALNTRLWKRSGPGGPLRRLGDAIYAPAEDGTLAAQASAGGRRRVPLTVEHSDASDH